jgi:hypothetical protein
MAKNLLIDTCVLKELVSKTDYSNYLKQIALWAEHDYVTIYVPNVLMEEWDKHKTIEEERIEKALKQYEGDKRKVSLFGLEEQIDIGEPELEFADKKLNHKLLALMNCYVKVYRLTREMLKLYKCGHIKKPARLHLSIKKIVKTTRC